MGSQQVYSKSCMVYFGREEFESPSCRSRDQHMLQLGRGNRAVGKINVVQRGPVIILDKFASTLSKILLQTKRVNMILSLNSIDIDR